MAAGATNLAIDTNIALVVTVAQALQDVIESVQSLEPEKPKPHFEASLQRTRRARVVLVQRAGEKAETLLPRSL